MTTARACTKALPLSFICFDLNSCPQSELAPLLGQRGERWSGLLCLWKKKSNTRLVNGGHNVVLQLISVHWWLSWYLSVDLTGKHILICTLFNSLALESVLGVTLESLFWTKWFQPFFRPARRMKWYQKLVRVGSVCAATLEKTIYYHQTTSLVGISSEFQERDFLHAPSGHRLHMSPSPIPAVLIFTSQMGSLFPIRASSSGI